MPVIAPERKAMPRPAARLWLAAWAVRTLARTDTIMPAKPAAPDSTAPIRKPMAAVIDRNQAMTMKTTTPTMPIVSVLAAEVGGGALLDGGGDLLHARRSGIGRQHVARRPDGVGDGHEAAENDEIDHGFSPSVRRLAEASNEPRNRPESCEKRPQLIAAGRDLGGVCTVMKRASSRSPRPASRNKEKHE